MSWKNFWEFQEVLVALIEILSSDVFTFYIWIKMRSALGVFVWRKEKIAGIFQGLLYTYKATYFLFIFKPFSNNAGGAWFTGFIVPRSVDPSSIFCLSIIIHATQFRANCVPPFTVSRCFLPSKTFL